MKIDVSAMHTEAEHEALYAVTLNGFEVTGLIEAQVPWDAVIVPEIAHISIEGGVGPHGVGTCTIRVRKSAFHIYYQVDVSVRESKRQEAIDYLTSLGIKIL